MPIQLFQIFLDKQAEPYVSGEQITGKFVIVVTEGYRHNGIYLRFEGHAIIKWTEDSSCFEHTVAKQHRARKQFFETMFKYASEENLPEGTHIFPFEYTLPNDLPSSLATPTTTIWYKMEALLNKDPKPRREVLVIPIRGAFDLNSNIVRDKLSKSVSEVKSKSLLAFLPPCFCNLNYVSIGIKLKKRGFLSGERVPIVLAVLTDTMSLTFVTLCLVQEITVVTKEKTMIERRTLVKLMLPDLHPEETEDDYRRWEQILTIPIDTIVTSEAHDDIQIKYFLRFSAEASKFPYKVIKLIVPVTIGSVGLVVEPPSPSHFSDISTRDQNYDHSPAHRSQLSSEKCGPSDSHRYCPPIEAQVVVKLIPEADEEEIQKKIDENHIPKIIINYTKGNATSEVKEDLLSQSQLLKSSQEIESDKLEVKDFMESEPDLSAEPEGTSEVELDEEETITTTTMDKSTDTIIGVSEVCYQPPGNTLTTEDLVSKDMDNTNIGVTESEEIASIMKTSSDTIVGTSDSDIFLPPPEFDTNSSSQKICSDDMILLQSFTEPGAQPGPSKPHRKKCTVGVTQSPKIKRAFCYNPSSEIPDENQHLLSKNKMKVGNISPIPENLNDSENEFVFSTTV